MAIEIPNLLFPYGQDKIEQAIQLQMDMPFDLKKKHGTPVAWSVEDHEEYYIFKCILTSLKMIAKTTVVWTVY